jgi:hypothetical protein
MTDTTYNGWSNYATWRINLEIFDGMDLDLDGYFVDGEEPDAYVLKDQLEEIVEESVFAEHRFDERRPSSLMEDYARAFLSEVNYYEIAEHLLRDYAEELKR